MQKYEFFFDKKALIKLGQVLTTYKGKVRFKNLIKTTKMQKKKSEAIPFQQLLKSHRKKKKNLLQILWSKSEICSATLFEIKVLTDQILKLNF